MDSILVLFCTVPKCQKRHHHVLHKPIGIRKFSPAYTILIGSYEDDLNYILMSLHFQIIKLDLMTEIGIESVNF